ncbi:MAG TPA: stalk domain-containing protein [Symbiobacteriaceae bacterium]|jgi:hypothetical protein
MKRIMAGLLLVMITLLSGVASASASAWPPGNVVTVDGKSLRLNADPVWVNGVVEIPVAPVVDALGGTLVYRTETFTATITAGGTTVVAKVGTHEATVDGRKVELYAPVVLKDGQLFLPAGFLLSTFGSRLDIQVSGIKNEIAMDLLKQSSTITLPNYGMAMRQDLQMSAGGQKATFSTTIAGQVQGKNLLLLVGVKSPALPGKGAAVMTAFRDGKMYTNAMDRSGWKALKPDAALTDALKSASSIDLLLGAAREVHLGQRGEMDGDLLQEIVVTFDGKALKKVMDPVLKAMLPPDGNVTITVDFQQATMNAAIDVMTGALVAQSLKVTAVYTLDDGKTKTNIQMVLDQFLYMHAESKDIDWPADLPR